MGKKILFTFLAFLLIVVKNTTAQTIFGLTSSNQVFVMSNANAPSSISGPYSVSGVASGQTLTSLDFNPYNGTLYALGYDSIMMHAQLYTINTSSWTASAVGSSVMSMNLGSAANVGFNFMSTTNNMIRVVATNGNNYIVNAVDGSLSATGSSGISYATGDIHYGSAATIGATAFTNSFYGADATNEIGYDISNNSVVTFDNTNTYNIHTTGLSGILISTGSSVGVDVYYDSASHNNTIYLSATPALGVGASLYTVSSTTGAAVNVGVIGSGTLSVRGISVQIKRNVPASISGQMVIGLTLNMRNLVFFDSYNPGIIRNSISLHGVASGQVMMAIAVSPQNHQLYGLAYNSATLQYQLYIIDTATGNVTPVNNAPATLNLGANSNAAIGIAFNPQTGYLHLAGNGGMNVMINAATGLVAVTDSNMYYAAGDMHFGTGTNVGSISYTNDYVGASSTQMTGVDFNTGALVSFSSGSNSSLTTVLDLSTLLGLGANSNGHVDYFYDSLTATNILYIATNSNGYTGGTNNYTKFYHSNSPAAPPVSNGDMNTPVKSVAVAKTYSGSAFVANTNSNASQLQVYPNPVLDEAHVMLPSPATSKVYVALTDVSGHVVCKYEYATGITRLDIDMSSLPTGYYTATIQLKGQIETVKLLRQN